MERKLIIGHEETVQGRDAVALGEQLSDVLDARPVRATVSPRHSGRILAELAEAEDAGLIVVGSTHRGLAGQVLLGTTGDSLLRLAPAAVAVAPLGFAERENPHLLRVGVAYDGSAESRYALVAGVNVAQRVHGALTVVSVVEPVHVGYGTTAAVLLTTDYLRGAHTRTSNLIDEALAQVPANLPVTGRALVGPPGTMLKEVSGQFDLLVMGSRGSGHLWRTSLGSVSSVVANGADCPLLVIPRGAGADPLGLVSPSIEQTV
jgi:nucleotide-binding universal stress UspA family protein